MAQPVLMDFTAVRNASTKCGQLADDLEKVYKELDSIGNELRAAAAMGAVGAEAARIVVEVLRILINMRRNKFQALKGYLADSYMARREGDTNAVPVLSNIGDL